MRLINYIIRIPVAIVVSIIVAVLLICIGLIMTICVNWKIGIESSKDIPEDIVKCFSECSGIKIDYEKLKESIIKSLNNAHHESWWF